jgi:GTP-binding protein
MAEGRAGGRDAPNAPGEGARQNDEQAALLEAGRLLFAQSCEFISGAVDLEGLPTLSLPEVAFAGRSNVGKSSLINALTGHTSLARVSHTPGRTQQINFFDLGHRLMLVDLPGYGYAAAPETVVKTWTRLADRFLRGRVMLKRVALLIDARRGLMASDRAVMTGLDERAVSYLVVLTKADALKPPALARAEASVREETVHHVAAYPGVIATSARSGEGIPALRAHFAALALPTPAR